MPGQPQASHSLCSSWSLEIMDFVVCIPFEWCLEMDQRGCATPSVLEPGGSFAAVEGFWRAPRVTNMGPGGSSATTHAGVPFPHLVTQIPLVASVQQLNPPTACQ